jgi:hypothetical protein
VSRRPLSNLCLDFALHIGQDSSNCWLRHH